MSAAVYGSVVPRATAWASSSSAATPGRASQDKALAAGDVDEVVRLFEEFDRLIYSQSGNRWINDLIENLEGHQRRIGRLTVGIPGRLAQSAEEHTQICGAVGRGDAEDAEKLMRSHIASVMADQLENFNEDSN